MLSRLPNISVSRNSITLEQWLILSCSFSCLLVCGRVIATGHLTYLFLVWNLFLAVVPYLISQYITNNIHRIASRARIFLLCFCWLLVVPNAFYIITDLFHLEQFDSAPKWFDLLLLFSFGWNGLIIGIISVRQMETLLEMAGGRKFSLLILSAVMWLNAFGIYLGRYGRYNSWDIITQPFSLFSAMLEILLHPIRNKMEWGMIGVYAVFMLLVYLTLMKLSENLKNTKQ